ncbi:creatininase family protein [Metallosphaera javensis (ex Sakai et al. 2022)]|uniref:creatininase family protein n=1 Tax=Metallosphaera javensis (ex Sakai et al. 2022) TaxID=2775498 RepID=UPI0025880845|nr:MAG: creatinine amidohydrolase [Metallosphaera javensis (ex Sakai et al. 2022)]
MKVDHEVMTIFMTWNEVMEKINNGRKTLFIPVGSTEQHGSHLPLYTDSLLATHISTSLAKRMNGLVGPLVSLGYSPYHLHFPGTVSLSSQTLKSILLDYISSAVNHGFERIIIIPAHGGNFKAVNEAINESGFSNVESYPDFERFSEIINQPALKRGIPRELVGAHGGIGETSLMLYLEPDLVRLDKLTKGYVGNVEKARELMRKQGIHTVSDVGIIGDPTLSSSEMGKEAFELLITELYSYFNKTINKL